MPGVFASGDAVKGARTVVEAVAYSKKVAEAMHEYMQTLPPELPTSTPTYPWPSTMTATDFYTYPSSAGRFALRFVFA